MTRIRGLGRPLRVRELLVGICLFELGFGLSTLLYILFESQADKLAVDLDSEIWIWFSIGRWIIFLVSIIPAGIGFTAAEGLMRPRDWRERALAGTLAGVGYGIGWLVPLAIGSLIPDVEAVGVLLSWCYMIAGPIVWFLVLARRHSKTGREQREPAA